MWLLCQTNKLWHFLSCCCFELLQLWRSWIFMRWSFLNQSAAPRQDAASSCNQSRTGSGWFTFTIRVLPITSSNSWIISLQAFFFFFLMNVDTRQTFILELLLMYFKQNCQNLSRVMELKYLCVLDQTSRLKTFLQVWWNVLFLTFHRNTSNSNINQQIHW